jgi:tripartite-type tricarboxylate transporter receptor subunit TctC
VKAGTMRIIAVTGESRMKDLPDVPTLKEKGFKQTFFVNWVGLFAPSGVPPAVISTLSEASEKVVKSKGYIGSIEKTGSLVEFMAPTEYQKMVEEEKKVTEAIALELGLKKSKK